MAENPNLTESEKDVLMNGFGKSDFFEDGLDSRVWSTALRDTTKKAKGKTISGVVASLVKKGIMVSVGGGEDAYVYLTEKGKEVFKQLRGE